MRTKFSILFLALLLPTVAFSQSSYEWLKIARYKVGNLDPVMKESSGLAFLNDKLYTLNDGGNPASLYEIDPSSAQKRNEISLPVKNKDWEALASDSTRLYIGEFGNNGGTRKDLKIYSVDPREPNKVDSIQYFYPEQKSFSGPLHQHNFDAESLVFLEGALHVFTKEFVSQNTTRYQISKDSLIAHQGAKKLETFDIGYMATDAAANSDRLFIVGYTWKMEVYLTVFIRDQEGNYFSSRPKKYFLGMCSRLGQVEGIAVDKDFLYISSEAFNKGPFNALASLYRVPIEKLN